MPLNVNSSSPGAERSRHLSVRCLRAVGLFLFSRRMVWFLAVTVSVLVLAWHYENWNGARELAAARQRMLARAGTGNPMDLLPPEVPEPDNFFAVPEIVSWREPSSNPDVAGGFVIRFPVQRFTGDEPALLEEPGGQRLDLAAWANSRNLAPGVSPAAVLLKELGDGEGTIARLTEGLTRPGSQTIPCRRRQLAAVGGEAWRAPIPAASAAFGFQKALGIRLRAAALAGDAGRTVDLAGIMLRLGDGFAGEPVLVSALVGLALHGITLDALNEALGCPALTDEQFRRIQQWLGTVNDVREVERTFVVTMVQSDAVFRSFRSDFSDQAGRILAIGDEDQRRRLETIWRYGPSGWLDANRARASDWMLAHCGDGGEEGWRSAAAGAVRVAGEVGPASVGFRLGTFVMPNPRRVLACIVLPAISNIWTTSARNLFHRRCAVLTCALHRFRLARGVYPESLESLAPEFLTEFPVDPAKADEGLHYRREEKGFLLWSAGDDRNDDGGEAEKDWIWRHGE